MYNEDRTHYIGAFNHLNAEEWQGLALSLIEGSGAVISIVSPSDSKLEATSLLDKLSKGTVHCCAERLSSRRKRVLWSVRKQRCMQHQCQLSGR